MLIGFNAGTESLWNISGPHGVWKYVELPTVTWSKSAGSTNVRVAYYSAEAVQVDAIVVRKL
jgi:hypothetical protein